MYKFNEYVLRRDEVSFNILDKTPLRSSGHGGNPDSTIVNKVGVPFGLPIAGISGIVPAATGIINAMRAAKSRAYGAAHTILDYLHIKPDLKGQIVDVIAKVIKKLEGGSHMGIVRAGTGTPTVDSGGHSTFGEIGAAVWNGIATSAVNMFDTIFGPRDVVVDSATLNFKKAYRVFFEQLGKLTPSEAFPLIKNFEHVLNPIPGQNIIGTGKDLDRSIWE
jgi:hypothetical protein